MVEIPGRGDSGNFGTRLNQAILHVHGFVYARPCIWLEYIVRVELEL